MRTEINRGLERESGGNSTAEYNVVSEYSILEIDAKIRQLKEEKEKMKSKKKMKSKL